MADPILDEIARVRQELIKKHGGIEGYIEYARKLDRAHRNRKKRKKTSKPKAKASS
jgi:hypothetical protein